MHHSLETQSIVGLPATPLGDALPVAPLRHGDLRLNGTAAIGHNHISVGRSSNDDSGSDTGQ